MLVWLCTSHSLEIELISLNRGFPGCWTLTRAVVGVGERELFGEIGEAIVAHARVQIRGALHWELRAFIV